MARRFPRAVVVRGHRRGSFWARSTADTGATALAASSSVIDQTLVVAADVTIVRIRGQIWVGSDQQAVNETPIGAVGCAVLSSESVAAAGAAVPTPVSDQDSQMWMMHQYFLHGFQFASAVGIDNRRFTKHEFDSKAMRKAEVGQDVAFIVQNISTVGLLFYLQFAMLIKTR